MKSIFLYIILSLTVSFSVLAGEREKKESESKPEKKSNLEMTCIKGTVIDASSGEGLAGVSITLAGINKTVYTDFDGNFNVEELIPGKYSITASLISYKEHQKEKVELTPEGDIHLKIDLELKY